MRLTVVTALVAEKMDEEILEYTRYFRTKNVSLKFIEDFLLGREVTLDTRAGEVVTKVRFQLDPAAPHLLKEPHGKQV